VDKVYLVIGEIDSSEQVVGVYASEARAADLRDALLGLNGGLRCTACDRIYIREERVLT